jgi:hypothetical protein
MKTRPLILWLTSAALLVVHGVAGAQEPAPAATEAPALDFDGHVEAAAGHFEAGRLAEALRSFEAAWAIKQDGNLLYNIAYLHEQLGHLEQAADHYDRFITTPGVELENRALAAERLKAIRGILLARREEAPAPVAAQPVQPVIVAAPAPASPAPPLPSPPAEGSTLRPVGLLVGGGGLVLMGAGVVTGLLANGAASDMEASSTLTERRGHADRADSLAVTTDALLFSGLAVTATGAVMYLLGGDTEGSPSPGLSLGPAVGPETFGVQVQGQF